MVLPSENYLPLDASAQPATERTATLTEFLLRCLLGARAETELPSNEEEFDEDVNVYLVGLLQRFLSAAYHEEAASYLRTSDIELSREVARARDDRISFRLYKTNADHLLLAIGLFRNTPGSQAFAAPLAYRTPESFVGRGGLYYQMASSTLRRLQRRRTGPEVALTKLGERFEAYARLLGCVRTSYFHLTQRLGDGSIYHLMHEPQAPDAAQVEMLYDRFLDAYSAWRQRPDQQTHDTLRAATEELRDADPEFTFQMPSSPDEPGSGLES
jgi:hypothetical protein